MTALPAVVSLMVVAAGALLPRRRRVDLPSVLVVGAWTLYVSIALAGQRAAGVSTKDFVEGMALGVVALGVLPAVAYYAIGRELTGRPLAIMVAWGALLV